MWVRTNLVHQVDKRFGSGEPAVVLLGGRGIVRLVRRKRAVAPKIVKPAPRHSAPNTQRVSHMYVVGFTPVVLATWKTGVSHEINDCEHVQEVPTRYWFLSFPGRAIRRDVLCRVLCSCVKELVRNEQSAQCCTNCNRVGRCRIDSAEFKIVSVALFSRENNRRVGRPGTIRIKHFLEPWSFCCVLAFRGVSGRGR